MANLSSRVAKLEAAQPNVEQSTALGFLDYDITGRLSGLTLAGKKFVREDESEEELTARAIAAMGPFDKVMWVSWIRAQGGKPAPGFERFADSAA